jgi:hypothetical protein
MPPLALCFELFGGLVQMMFEHTGVFIFAYVAFAGLSHVTYRHEMRAMRVRVKYFSFTEQRRGLISVEHKYPCCPPTPQKVTLLQWFVAAKTDSSRKLFSLVTTVY